MWKIIMNYEKLNNIQRGIVRTRSNDKENSGSKHTVAILYDNKFYAKSNKKPYEFIPIKINQEDLNNVDYIYSNGITNNQHKPWTIKKNSKNGTRLDITIKYWSIVKPRQRIKGIIEDGYFILDIDYVNTISKLYYLKSQNKIENANRKDKKF
jgi:hypothetical protein